VPEPEATEEVASTPHEDGDAASGDESEAPADTSAEPTGDAPSAGSEASDGWTEDN
jgi:hypothetical protein